MPKEKKSAIETIEDRENAAEPITETKTRTRTFRSAEVRIAELDKKIAFHKKSIEQLEAKKGKVGTARRERKVSFAKVYADMKSSGKSPEQILAFLKGE